MDWITDPQAWIALATLTVLEIVLGIDNVIFISILAGKLPREQQGARPLHRPRAGDGHAHRCCCFSLSWVIRLTAPLFTVLGQEISGRDLILLIGGLFLLARAPTRSTRSSRARRARRPPRVAPSFAQRDRSRSCCSTSSSRSTR